MRDSMTKLPGAMKSPRRLTELRTPLVRRIGNLVVRIETDGVRVRYHRRRAWSKLVPWDQVVCCALLIEGCSHTAEEWRKPIQSLARLSHYRRTHSGDRTEEE